MPFVKVGTENAADIEIHYNDHGTGQPMVLIHGYPLDANSWERQERVLLANGYRCISYDFRDDLAKIDIPTLVVHGTADRILPFESTAARLRDENLIADLTVVEVDNGPHNVGWTHPEEVNKALLGFLAGTTAALESVG